MTEKFKESELILVNGKIYHLDMKPEQLAKDILIVGDPDRVTMIADEFFDRIEHEVYHRGLRTITGYTKGTNHRVSLVTSGMGTPSLEIVLNEIVILNEIDIEKREQLKEHDMINIIRVGTSGAVQKDTKLGTPIISQYAIGMDNTGLFYDLDAIDENCLTLENNTSDMILEASKNSRFHGMIMPYVSMASPDIVEALITAAEHRKVECKCGITVSNSGFFANQGRNVSRAKLSIDEIDKRFSTLETGISGIKVENLEMETSFLLHYMMGLGYRAGAICPTIANRMNNTFAEDYSKNVKDATQLALDALFALRTG